jgi:hypothetical protein
VANRRALTEIGLLPYHKWIVIIASGIELARARILKAFAARSVEIRDDSELWFVLEEMRLFSEGTRDLQTGDSNSQTDDLAVIVGLDLVRGMRLHNELSTLLGTGVPHVVETLRTLASFKHSKPQHRSQFGQSEYELHMAAQFHGFGERVSFVDTRRPSRYKQRVEFMVGYKWPVECKHPQSERKIIPNVDAALKKLTERGQAGIICIGLEQALPMTGEPYLEVIQSEDVLSKVSQHVAPWFAKHKRILASRLTQSCGRFIVFTYSSLAYVHDSETVALPSLRLALSVAGNWIEENVIETCLEHLRRERDEAQSPE